MLVESIWKATTKGHNVEFMVAPDDIKYKSKMHKSAGYTFTTPGIYTYKCTPHFGCYGWGSRS